MIRPAQHPADPFEEAYAQAGPATRAFLEHVAARPECLREESFRDLRAAGESWGCDLQPWPVVVDRDVHDRLAAAALAVSRLVRALPRRLFGAGPGGIGRLSRYYELHDPALTALIVGEPNGFDEALGRGDFLLTADGPRCLELNMGSHLGGWQHDRVAGAYLDHPLLSPYFSALGERVTRSDLLPVLLEHLIATSAADAQEDGELNVVFVVTDEAAGSADLTRFDAEAAPRFAALLAGRRLRGGLLYLPYSRLEERDGRLWTRVEGKERRVHAVVEVEEGETARHAFRCFKAGGIRLYNGLSSAVLSDKRNLALLSENESDNEASAAFSPEEREAIRRFVPWTRAVCPRYVRYRGERVFLPDFLAARRRSLVLKPARGTAGGEGVVVGRLATEAEWAATVRRALAERWWIAQEHVESLPFLALTDGGAEPHDLVWGMFVFGPRFAGANARMLPRLVGGVINAARGARQGPVFIVEPPGRRHSLDFS